MEKNTLQEETHWEDLTLLEGLDDSSGDTSGAAEFLDEVRAGREKRKAIRLRRAMRNVEREKEVQAQQSSSPPPEGQHHQAKASKKSARFIHADVVDHPPATSPMRKVSPMDVEKRTERPLSKQLKDSKPSRGARKRKRVPSVQLVPETLRVFEGLRFCKSGPPFLHSSILTSCSLLAQ